MRYPPQGSRCPSRRSAGRGSSSTSWGSSGAAASRRGWAAAVWARQAFLALAACLALQGLEGFSWFFGGNYDLATTQLKVTSVFSSACACVLVVFAADPARRRLAGCASLVRLGPVLRDLPLPHGGARGFPKGFRPRRPRRFHRVAPPLAGGAGCVGGLRRRLPADAAERRPGGYRLCVEFLIFRVCFQVFSEYNTFGLVLLRTTASDAFVEDTMYHRNHGVQSQKFMRVLHRGCMSVLLRVKGGV